MHDVTLITCSVMIKKKNLSRMKLSLPSNEIEVEQMIVSMEFLELELLHSKQ